MSSVLAFVGGVEMTSILIRAACVLLLITLSVPVTAASQDAVTTPDILGMVEADALAALEAAGLTVGERTLIAEGEPGTVVMQDPAVGTTVAVGSAVDYTVVDGTALPSSPGASAEPSTGPSAAPGATEGTEADRATIVPDIVGMPEGDALLALAAADLVPGERMVIIEGEPGVVVAQEPGPGAEESVGTAVRYAVVDATPGASDGWDAFMDRLQAFLHEMDVMAFIRAVQGSDDELAHSLAMSMHATSIDVVAWLDEHPSAPCYDEAWQALRSAGELMASATDLYVTKGFEKASSQLMEAGSAFVDLGGMLQASGAACRAAD